MIRASVEDADKINDWIWRDSGRRADFTEFLSNRMNVCLIEGEGGALFVWRGPGIFEVHVFFEPRGKAHRQDKRGERILALSHLMLDYMRERGARIFWAAVPTDEPSRHVIMFTRLMGWESQGIVSLPEGQREIFSLES